MEGSGGGGERSPDSVQPLPASLHAGILAGDSTTKLHSGVLETGVEAYSI